MAFYSPQSQILHLISFTSLPHSRIQKVFCLVRHSNYNLALKCEKVEIHRIAFRKPLVVVMVNDCNCKLEISTTLTKAKSREPTYSQAFNQNKIYRQRVKIQIVWQGTADCQIVHGFQSRDSEGG